jgi:hypothetical protein
MPFDITMYLPTTNITMGYRLWIIFFKIPGGDTFFETFFDLPEISEIVVGPVNLFLEIF